MYNNNFVPDTFHIIQSPMAAIDAMTSPHHRPLKAPADRLGMLQENGGQTQEVCQTEGSVTNIDIVINYNIIFSIGSRILSIEFLVLRFRSDL